MEENQIVELGEQLLAAVSNHAGSLVRQLISQGAPLWYQDPGTGWSALHFAAHNEDEVLVKELLQAGATWNLVDTMGNTAGDIALSLNNNHCYELVRDAGIRSEMVLHLLGSREAPVGMILQTQDKTAAGSSEAFLSSHLTFTTDQNGQELCLVESEAETVGVMMGWERPIMEETVWQLCSDLTPADSDGIRVLNCGFGLGIIDSLFQALPTGVPVRHVIIEAHPDVLSYMRSKGWYEKIGVEILEGKWQEYLETEGLMGDGGFDVIYTDTFGEHYRDLHQFFEQVPNLLRGPNSRFSFFNGLGATNALFYDVFTKLADLHLTEIGLVTEWTDVNIHQEQHGASSIWGESRKYFTLPFCRIPIVRMEK